MRRTLLEHLGSVALVALVFGLLLWYLESREASDREARNALVAPYLHLPYVDFGNPRDRALFRETLNLFRPGSLATNDSLLAAIESYRQSLFTDPAMKTGAGDRGVSWETVRRIGGMYLRFIIVYALVLGLTFYASQTLAMVRFVHMKQGRESYWVEFIAEAGAWWHADAEGKRQRGITRVAVPFLKAIGTGLLSAILFSPGYVTGYAFRASMEMDSLLFMILLGVASNGLLMNYANKFYALLVTESRKGYVETALVKNLSGSYAWNSPQGISYRSLVRLPRRFAGHVFQHVYLNARYQYLSTLKEQASFLITGLIIIEMALNIQGHLCYELLQDILYRRYAIALVIVLGIFILVKVTEIGVDVRRHLLERRYENRV